MPDQQHTQQSPEPQAKWNPDLSGACAMRRMPKPCRTLFKPAPNGLVEPVRRARMQRVFGTACALLALLPIGCIEGGFLVTPVSGRRPLVEQVIVSESVFASDKIALIDVSGIITDSATFSLFGSGEHPVSRLLEQLDKARRDGNVKAVILRINSPGGGVVASELMHNELTYFRNKTGKPIVALMMDVAASGGYYIACACDEIVAHQSTVTGSIGVLMQMFNVTKTMKMIGVSSDTITSGPRKDAGSPFREMKPEEREIFQSIVNDMYERFLQVVADGRPEMDEDTIRRLADGRVYSASQALENGLIDRIATMRETVAALKEQIGAKKIRLVRYKRPYEHRPNFYTQAPHVSPNSNVNLINIDLANWRSSLTPGFLYLWQPGS